MLKNVLHRDNKIFQSVCNHNTQITKINKFSVFSLNHETIWLFAELGPVPVRDRVQQHAVGHNGLQAKMCFLVCPNFLLLSCFVLA